MTTNTLKAIINIKNLKEYDLKKIYENDDHMKYLNRIQNVGALLESFIQDAYANSFFEKNKDELYSKYFSYKGNANNPPDFIIKNSDAIEVKKLTSDSGEIQFNSSYPKSKIFSEDERITKACKNCESTQWRKKDIIYAIGTVPNKKNNLKILSLIYGDCYAADKEVYENISNRIADNLSSSFPESKLTNELARINNVDPLGITKLRVRGMWLISNPLKVFSEFFNYKSDNQKFTLFCLMKEEKFNSFNIKDRNLILEDEEINCEKIQIKDPNNPVKKLNCIFIRYDQL